MKRRIVRILMVLGMIGGFGAEVVHARCGHRACPRAVQG